MKISIIVAAAEDNAIGKDNRLIWRLPDDMKFFKEKTTGHCVVTGRKNYESIPENFRPLPGRTNMVVTRSSNYKAPGAIVVHSLEDAVKLAKEKGEKELFIIGGGEIYRQSLPLATDVWLTRVHHFFPDAHTFFPELGAEWKCEWKEEHGADAKHQFAFTFFHFARSAQ